MICVKGIIISIRVKNNFTDVIIVQGWRFVPKLQYTKMKYLDVHIEMTDSNS